MTPPVVRNRSQGRFESSKYREKHHKLETLERLGWRFGLESIRVLLSELGDPQNSLKCIHVAGPTARDPLVPFWLPTFDNLVIKPVFIHLHIFVISGKDSESMVFGFHDHLLIITPEKS